MTIKPLFVLLFAFRLNRGIVDTACSK